MSENLPSKASRTGGADLGRPLDAQVGDGYAAEGADRRVELQHKLVEAGEDILLLDILEVRHSQASLRALDLDAPGRAPAAVGKYSEEPRGERLRLTFV